ncbi:MAG: metal ABC transporter solute-binding protein, Zn/Mn family [Puniceicoccales bacterium]
MKKNVLLIIAVLGFVSIANAEPKKYPYEAVTTVGMITDVVRNVAGDKANVDGIIGEGIDPHLYKPTRKDVIALSKADIVFYNGLMLEGKMADVLVRLARKGKPIYAVTDTILEKPADLQTLRDQLNVHNELYQKMMERLQSEMAQVALDKPNARLIDEAVASKIPTVSNPPSQFKAGASVQILRGDGSDNSILNTQVEMIRSDRVIEQVAKHLTESDRNSLLEARNENAAEESSITEILSSNLTVEPIKQSLVIQISYTDANAETAARIANLFAKEYIRLLVNENIKSAMPAVEDLRLRAEQEKEKVEALREQINQGGSYVMSDESEHYDPHVWMDVQGWIMATSVIADALAEFDPKNAEYYASNANRYIAELEALDAYAKKVIGSIPENQRYLVTAHDAFNYLGRAYGIEVMGIQGLSTESEAGVRDLERLVNFLVENKIPAGFVETSVSDKNVRALIEGAQAKGHQLKIGGELFSDAMGPAGTYEGTYIGMIDHNATTIARALGGDAPESGKNGKLAH